MADTKEAKPKDLEQVLKGHFHEKHIKSVEDGFKAYKDFREKELPKIQAEHLKPAFDTFYTTFQSELTKNIGDLSQKLNKKDHQEHVEDALAEALHAYVSHIHPGAKDLLSKDKSSDRKDRLQALQNYVSGNILQSDQDFFQRVTKSGGLPLHMIPIDKLLEQNDDLTGYGLLNKLSNAQNEYIMQKSQVISARASRDYLETKFQPYERAVHLESKAKGKYDVVRGDRFINVDPESQFKIYEHLTDPDKTPLVKKDYEQFGLKKYEGKDKVTKFPNQDKKVA